MARECMRSRFWRRRRFWRGMTIWQVMLGVMLAGIAALTAVDLYQSGQEANNRNESVLLLQRLRVGIERTFSGDPSYGSADTNLVPVLARRGLIPDAALVVTAGEDDDDPDVTTIRHPFGGNVTVVGHVDSEPTHFKVTFEDVEAEVCAALADGYVGRTRARSGIVKIDFGGTEEDAPIERSDVTDMEWLQERAEERLQRLAGAQAAALSEAVAVWVESDFEARLASAPRDVTLATLRTAGVLAPGFAVNGRDALGRSYRVLMRRVPGDALDVLVTQRVPAGDDLLPVNAVFGAGGQVRIGVVDPDARPVVLRGPAIRADMSGFRGDFPGAPELRAIGVLQRFDRQSVFGDFLYRRRIAGLPGANAMETDLDMGGNDVTGARNVEADELVLERDLQVGGSLRVTAGLLVGGTAQVNGIATVSGELRADSASVVGALSADSGTIANEMRANRVVATGEVRGGSIGTGGALSAGSGSITGPVVAASVAAGRANVRNDVVAASARVGSLTAASATVTGNANVTGSVTAGSVNARSSVTANSAGFSSLVVGNCIGC